MSVESTFHDEVKSVVSELRSIANGLSGKPDAGIGWNPLTIVNNAGLITGLANKLTDALAVAEASTEVPEITSISPPSGPAGTVITITGSGFGDSPDGAVVMVSGVHAHPNSWSPNKITVTIPQGIEKGDVGVTTSGGKSTGSFAFTPDAPPEPIVPKPISTSHLTDPEPVIDAEPGTSEFAAQSTRHRAWEQRQSTRVAPSSANDPEPLITAQIGTPEFSTQTTAHDVWLQRQKSREVASSTDATAPPVATEVSTQPLGSAGNPVVR